LRQNALKFATREAAKAAFAKSWRQDPGCVTGAFKEIENPAFML